MSALDVRCPTCGARANWGCETQEGYFRERPHEARKQSAIPAREPESDGREGGAA